MTWRLFVCCDCDNDEGVLIHQVPDGAHEDRACNVEFCPGCNSHMGLIAMGDVTVTGNSLLHLRMRGGTPT